MRSSSNNMGYLRLWNDPKKIIDFFVDHHIRNSTLYEVFLIVLVHVLISHSLINHNSPSLSETDTALIIYGAQFYWSTDIFVNLVTLLMIKLVVLLLHAPHNECL